MLQGLIAERNALEARLGPLEASAMLSTTAGSVSFQTPVGSSDSSLRSPVAAAHLLSTPSERIFRTPPANKKEGGPVRMGALSESAAALFSRSTGVDIAGERARPFHSASSPSPEIDAQTALHNMDLAQRLAQRRTGDSAEPESVFSIARKQREQREAETESGGFSQLQRFQDLEPAKQERAPSALADSKAVNRTEAPAPMAKAAPGRRGHVSLLLFGSHARAAWPGSKPEERGELTPPRPLRRPAHDLHLASEARSPIPDLTNHRLLRGAFPARSEEN